jgi:lipid-A-disaccharide synthase
MRPYVDRILCILPFEQCELVRLGGPPGIYVGHRLSHDAGVLAAAKAQAAPHDFSTEREKTLLVLPGSRSGEVNRLIGPFGETVAALRARGHHLRLLLPTVPHVAELVRSSVSGWEQQPEIIVDQERKWQAFGQADAALIASGTVSLELALSRVPMISCYKLDPLARQLARRVMISWSASLPNLIADQPLVPEYYDDFVRPQILARELEALFADSGMRSWQKEGFAEVARRMATTRPAGELAAEAVLQLVRK